MPQPNRLAPTATPHPHAEDGMGILVSDNVKNSSGARRSKGVAFWSLLIVGYALCALYSVHVGVMRLDEPDHFEQIRLFRHGVFHPIVITLTTVPGYHLFLALLLKLLGTDSFAAARVLSSLFGLLAVVGFHRLRRDVVGRDDYLATAQFAVLPIFLLFVFMVQTDVASLALMLWATWAAGRQRHWLAGSLLLAAECVRQNNVLWLVLLVWPLLHLLAQQRSVRGVVQTLLGLLPYGLAGGIFTVYWLAHGTVVWAQNEISVHPDFSLHSGNLFCLMFFAAFLYVFPCMESWRRFIADVRTRPWLIVLPLLLLALYLGTFRVDHPFNLLRPPDLRNGLLMYTQASTLWYWGFALIAIFGGIGLLWQRLMITYAAVFWALTALFISLSWLIEQRYYLISFALFMAWRVAQTNTREYLTLALWAPFAVLFLWGMMTGLLYI